MRVAEGGDGGRELDSGAPCQLEPACLSGSSVVTTGLPVDFMEY